MTHRVCGFDPTKCFPIVGGKSVLRNDAEKAHETYSALFGTEQSLDRLGERGGFHPDEFALLVKGINPLHTGDAWVDKCDECKGAGEVIDSEEGGIWFKCGRCLGCGLVVYHG